MLHMSNRMNRMMNQSSRLIPCQTCLGRQTMSHQTITPEDATAESVSRFGEEARRAAQESAKDKYSGF